MKIPFVPVLNYLRALLGVQFQQFIDSGLPLAREMLLDLQHVVIRVNSFVKTFETVSEPMLFEYFLRGSGIACREAQPAADLVTPLYAAAVNGQDVSQETQERSSLVNPGQVYAFQTQIKRWCRLLGETQAREAFEKMRCLHTQLTPNYVAQKKFPVSLLMELTNRPVEPVSSKTSVEGPALKKAGFAESSVSVTKKDGIYEIRASRLSVVDVESTFSQADASFKRLLESAHDPRKIACIPENFRQLVPSMFDTQPYMTLPAEPKYRKDDRIKQ